MCICILKCMSDPQIYQTWLFLIDHWSLYIKENDFIVNNNLPSSVVALEGVQGICSNPHLKPNYLCFMGNLKTVA